mmetsp:Transcript_24257/g.33942  ORF Transcript_24257/g.33942 Transcript_24257/m.33942 type:complete len:108 (+) Transcript_24257:1-324(+)
MEVGTAPVKFKKLGRKRNFRQGGASTAVEGESKDDGAKMVMNAKDEKRKDAKMETEINAILGPNGEERRSGVCKWWHQKKKFGFVILNDSGDEAFCHYTQVPSLVSS